MIHFITRSLYPFHPAGGGVARFLQVRDLVRDGHRVRIILPLDENTKEMNRFSEVYDKSVELVRVASPVSVDLGRAMQALGMFNDYLSVWARRAFRTVVRDVKSSDTVLTTSGGELGSLELGVMLKERTGCRLVHHLHDPPDHVDIDGLRVPARYPHRNRKRAFARLLRAADQVYTTNALYARHLEQRYRLRSVCCRYIFDRDIANFDSPRQTANPNFVYAGNMSAVQRPEVFQAAWTHVPERDRATLTFVGSTDLILRRGGSTQGVTCLPIMDRHAFLRYSQESVDVGLVSLYDPYHAYCTPSKLFDSILMAKPLVTAGSGDLVDLVKEHDLGETAHPGDVSSLARGMARLVDPDERRRVRESVIRFAGDLLRTPMYPGVV